MKGLRIVSAVVALGVIVAMGLGWWYWSAHARGIFYQKISSLVHRKVFVRSLTPAFPLACIGTGLEVDGLVTAESFRIDIDWRSFFYQEIEIAAIRLDRPVMTWSVAKHEDAADLSLTDGSSASPTPTESRPFLFRRVEIRQGTFKIQDPASRIWEFEGVDADLHNVAGSGHPARTEFSARAVVSQERLPFLRSSVQARGWWNWALKDMDVTLEVASLDQTARADARLVSSQNHLRGTGRLVVLGARVPRGEDESVGLAAHVVRDVLSASQTDIEAGFSFETRMAPFSIGQVSFQGNITTGLNSSETSGTIVQSLKAIGAQFLHAAEADGTK